MSQVNHLAFDCWMGRDLIQTSAWGRGGGGLPLIILASSYLFAYVLYFSKTFVCIVKGARCIKACFIFGRK